MSTGPSDEARASRRRLVGYALSWVLAAAVAISIGVIAVSSVGASIRDRGPTVNEAIREAQLDEVSEGQLAPLPEAETVRREIADEFGVFVVECRGAVAYGKGVEPASGWRVISFENGPDDDVDAVFSHGDRSIEIEVFCNNGKPTISEIERKSLPDND